MNNIFDNDMVNCPFLHVNVPRLASNGVNLLFDFLSVCSPLKYDRILLIEMCVNLTKNDSAVKRKKLKTQSGD